MKASLAIVSSFVIAMFLTIMPLPAWAVWFRPGWVPLVLLYWSIALPHRVSLGIAWILGLLLDVLQGSLLGEHALALTIMVYFAVKIHRQFRVFPIAQQALSVMLLIGVYQFFLFWIQGAIGQSVNWLFWLPLLTSLILWPWISNVLRDVRRRFKVH